MLSEGKLASQLMHTMLCLHVASYCCRLLHVKLYADIILYLNKINVFTIQQYSRLIHKDIVVTSYGTLHKILCEHCKHKCEVLRVLMS